MPQLTTFRLYLLGLALLFGGYVALEYNRPKPLDWTPTYANKDKIPYGTFALYDQLPRLLGTDSVEVVRLPVYSQLTGLSLEESALADVHTETTTVTVDSTATDSTTTVTTTLGPAADSTADEDAATTTRDSTAAGPTATAEATTDSATIPAPKRAGSSEEDSTPDDEESEEAPDQPAAALPLRPGRANYLFINESFELSAPDSHALLQFVARGNDALIAAQSFSSGRGLLRDSLGFDVSEVDLPTHRGAKGLPAVDSVELHFTNPALAARRYRLPGTGVGPCIVVDSGRVGRTLATDAQGRAVLVRLDYGRGHFYFCTAPVAFTNYYLLRPRTTGFAAGALAYLPARRTFWDEYQKQGPVGEQSLLRVVIAHEALRAAYYLTLAGALLFVFVEARRRQRIIPTLRPLPNTTLLFTRTVAGLYRQGRSHALIAEKKVSLFLDYLRTRFQEPTPDFGDEAFRERLAHKAGLPRARVDELLRLVNFARTAPQVTDRELLTLSRALNDFRREARR